MRFFMLRIYGVMAAVSAPLWAQTTEERAAAPLNSGSGWILVKTMLALAFVVALVWVMTWALKKLASRQSVPGGAGVRVVSATSLGPKKSIYLVDVADRRLVLGATDQQITCLTEMERPDEAVETALPEKRSHGGFRQVLDGVMNRRGGHE